MKIILVNTLPRKDYWLIMSEDNLPVGLPMGLLSIGTVLQKAGYEVVIIDPLVDKDYMELLANELDDSCLFVGISAMTAGVANGLEIAEFVRKARPELPIVWGGIHPTIFPEQTLRDSLVDIVVIGEGEKTALEIANALSKGGDLSRVKGIGFKLDGELIFTRPQDFLSFDEIPPENYDLLDMQKYLLRDVSQLIGGEKKLQKVIVLHTGRGCPYNCSFCINTHPSQKWRMKSFERLLQEIDLVVQKYDPDFIHFQDDNFFVDKDRSIKLLEEIDRRRYRFKWFSLARANYFNNKYINNYLAKKMAEKCLWLGIGVESASPRMLKKMRKGIDLSQVLRTAKISSRNGLKIGYAFMTGMPNETREEQLETLRFIIRLKTLHPNSDITYQYFRPYPGTEMYRECQDLGFREPQTLREWGSIIIDDTGYIPLEKLPWVKNPSFIRTLILAARVFDKDLSKVPFWRKVVLKILRVDFKIRLRFNFWRFLFELKIATWRRKHQSIDRKYNRGNVLKQDVREIRNTRNTLTFENSHLTVVM